MAIFSNGCTTNHDPAANSTSSTSSSIGNGKTAEAAPTESSRKNTRAPEVDTDPTLHTDEYEARGMPSVQNPWSLKDYEAALSILVALAKENPALLPRAGSKHSGTVFQRVVSRENLQPYARRDTDLHTRQMSLASMSQVLANVINIYFQTLMQGQPHDREVLELLVLTGHATAVMWRNEDEVATLFYHNDPGLAERLNGLHQMQMGAEGMMRGMVITLHDRQMMAMKNQIWFASELREFMPELISRLEPADRLKLKGKISRLASSEPEPELATQLKLLRAAISQAKAPLLPRAGQPPTPATPPATP